MFILGQAGQKRFNRYRVHNSGGWIDDIKIAEVEFKLI
jgi:hypothetical protein